MNLTDPPIGTRFFNTDRVSIAGLWEKMKGFDPLFSDDSRWDLERFYEHLYSRTTVILEIDNGVLFLTGLLPGHFAQIHACFWDHRMSDKVVLLKDCLIWAFALFNLVRLEALIPDFSRALRRILVTKLGFTFEGEMRRRMKYKGRFHSIVIYSILREELIDG